MAKKIRKKRANYFEGGGFKYDSDASFGKNMSGAFKSGALNGAISGVSSMVGQGISGGMSTGVGNTMQGVGKIASAIPGPYGAIASAALNVVGGVVNRAFGSQINEQAVQEAKAANTQQSTKSFKASSTTDILNQSNFGQLGSIKKSDIGKDGWFSNKAANLAADLNKQREIANQQALANFNTTVDNVETQNDMDALANYAAYGGPLTMRYTGAMSPFGNRFAEGGGIYIKPENRGKFTRLKERTGKSASWFKEHGTPAQKKMATFALNARKWKHGLGGSLYQNGGNMGSTNGGDFTNGMLHINNGGTHEENPMEGVQMGMDAQGIPNLVEEGEVIFNDYVFSDRMNVPNSMRHSLGLNKSKNLTFAKAAKKLSKESEERPNDPISRRGLFDSMSKLQQAQESLRQQDQEGNSGVQYAHGGKMGILFAGEEGDDVPQHLRRPEYLYDWSGIDTMFDNQNFTPSNLKGNLPYSVGSNTNIAATSDPKRHNSFTEYALSLPDTHNYWTTLSSKTGKPVSYLRENYNSLRNDGKLGYVSLDPQPYTTIPNSYPIPEDAGAPWLEVPNAPVEDAASDTAETNTTESGNRSNNNNNSKLTWLRYAPVVGAAIGLGQNLFSKPDYSSSEDILNAAKEAGRYTPVDFNPLGDYLTYRPFDRNYYINKLNANSSATRRAIVNQSAGNRATAMAGLLAADYNAQGKLGDLARQAEEYNLGQRERVAAFNRSTNQYNSEMGLKVAMANEEAAARARNQRLSGIVQAMQVRDAVDARRGASMSANLTNLFNSIGDIGREGYSRNTIISNPGLYYSVGNDGTVSYKKGFYDLSEKQQEQVKKDAESQKKKQENKTSKN